MCREKGTLFNHILSGCQVSCAQGKYRWRHDRVLRELAEKIRQKVAINRDQPSKAKVVKQAQLRAAVDRLF